MFRDLGDGVATGAGPLLSLADLCPEAIQHYHTGMLPGREVKD